MKRLGWDQAIAGSCRLVAARPVQRTATRWAARRRKACIGALHAIALASSAQADLLVNGSFESPSVPVGFYTNFAGGSTAISGWTVVGVDSAVTSGSFSQSGITFQAQNGVQWLDLAGITSNSQTSGVNQSVATVAGSSYQLDFFVGSALDNVFFFPSTVALSIDGGPRISFSNPNTTAGALNWLGFSYTFTATGTSTSITFLNGSNANNYSTGLDNVTLNLVPTGTFYSYSGAVSTYPTNQFPINTGVANLALGNANTLSVGAGSAGSFSALAGAVLSVGGIEVGAGRVGSGTVNISGAQVAVGGPGNLNRIQVGNWGTGTMVVSGGGLVDATVNASACQAAVAGCYNFIGNAAGSNATLTITGAGSEVRTLRSFTVGGVNVFTQASSGFDFGTAGANTTGTVNVLAGGTLRTQSARLGVGPSGTAPLGTERSFATALIDGAGSQWVVTRNAIDGGAAQMILAQHANATADVTVSAGGRLLVDGTGSNGPNDGISVATAGTATLVVTGAGSRVDTMGVSPYINVGSVAATANGSFKVLSGATASSLFMNVGRDGATGTLLVDGAGSQLVLSGVGQPVSPGAASISIGRLGGTGFATLSNGGQMTITDGGMDSRPGNSSPGFTVGRQAGGTGTLTIDGAGSLLQVVSTSQSPGAGVADNFNPFGAVGRESGSTGTLTVSNGGKLVLTGNAISLPTVANSRSTSLNIGGASDTDPGGTGNVLVTGAGSTVRVEGSDGFVGVGRGGNGTLTLENQALLATMIINVGRSGGTGVMNMNNAFVELSGQQTGNNLSGAGFTVGSGGGTGTMTMANASVMTITNLGSSGAGVNVGGTSVFPLGDGTLTLSGGSRITVTAASTLGSFSVGRDGSGRATIGGASTVDIGDGTVHVGRFAGATGTLTVNGGSRVSAGVANIGGSADDGTAGGNGTLAVSGSGSVLAAYGATGLVAVGRGGTGTATVSNGGEIDAIVVAVGRAGGGSGSLSVDGARLVLAGQQAPSATSAGAALSIGSLGGTGSATITNGSTVTISNPGSLGVSLNVGGTPIRPLGTGTLAVSGGSQVTLSAGAGLANVRIGYDGNGTATISGASALNAAGGNVIIGSEAGSQGGLTVSGNSTVQAAYVGVGSRSAGVDGGSGTLIVNSGSSITATTIEVGRNGLLGGDGGVLKGNVVNRGVLSPGESPGVVTVDGFFQSLDGSRIVLDIQANGSGGYSLDKVVLTQASSFLFGHVTVLFNFLGNTDPTAAGAAGIVDLDNFLRTTDGTNDTGLSSVFTGGATWNSVLQQADFAAASPSYSVTNLQLAPNGSGAFTFTATPVPEPQTWLLWGAGLLVLRGLARRPPPRRTPA